MDYTEFNELYRIIIEKNVRVWLESYLKLLIKDGYEFIDCKKMSEDSTILDEFVNELYTAYLFLKSDPSDQHISDYLSSRTFIIDRLPCFSVFATNEPLQFYNIFIYKKILEFVQTNLIC